MMQIMKHRVVGTSIFYRPKAKFRLPKKLVGAATVYSNHPY